VTNLPVLDDIGREVANHSAHPHPLRQDACLIRVMPVAEDGCPAFSEFNEQPLGRKPIRIEERQQRRERSAVLLDGRARLNLAHPTRELLRDMLERGLEELDTAGIWFPAAAKRYLV